MPLDIPQDDDFDDSLPDISGYEGMNIVNDVNNGNDSDFSDFSSDDDDNNEAREAAANNQEQRYANYELIGQGNDNVNGQALNSDDEEHEPTNRLYQHNFVVQWIETNEPLFDRAQYEAQQARQTQNNNNQVNNQNNESQRQVVENPISEPIEEPSTSQPIPNDQNNHSRNANEVKLDTEKIDIIKGLMSNFKLPDESVPGWAKEISEDQWKNYLTTKFHDKPS